MTRYAQAEKLEIIRMVEESELSVKQTLSELEVPRSNFYRWYRHYLDQGYAGGLPDWEQPAGFLLDPHPTRFEEIVCCLRSGTTSSEPAWP